MKFFIFVSVLFSFASYSLEKPYEPSFTAKHPKMVQSARSAGVGIAVSALSYAGLQATTKQDSSNCLKFALPIGLVSGLAVYYLKPVYISFLDAVLCHPDQALLAAYQVEDQMKKEAQRQKLDGDTQNIEDHTKKLKLAHTLIKRFESQCPFVLLGECTNEGFGPCVLSRTYKKKYRNQFEDAIGKALSQKSSLSRPIVYTSFGCGGSFQDLVILTKWLSKNPLAQLDIHLVDLQHTPLVACLDFLNNQRQINKQPIDYASVMQQLLEKGKKEWGGDKHPEEKATMELSATISHLDLKHKEFLDWLQNNFPKAQIRLFSHDNAKSYLDFTQKNNLEYPDVISAADIQDEMSQLRKSINNYLALCAKTLEKKPSSINILLTKMLEKNGNYRVSLLTCAKDNIPGCEEAPYTDFEKQEQTLYYTEKNL